MDFHPFLFLWEINMDNDRGILKNGKSQYMLKLDWDEQFGRIVRRKAHISVIATAASVNPVIFHR
jgi:hypothetical protein